MALYTIRTTRKQEVGLKFSYDTYADKLLFPTQQDYFQHLIDTQISDPLYVAQQNAQLKSFDASFQTIPETEQPVAQTEIEGVITAHGGTIVPASPPVPGPTIAVTEAP